MEGKGRYFSFRPPAKTVRSPFHRFPRNEIDTHTPRELGFQAGTPSKLRKNENANIRKVNKNEFKTRTYARNSARRMSWNRIRHCAPAPVARLSRPASDTGPGTIHMADRN